MGKVFAKQLGIATDQVVAARLNQACPVVEVTKPAPIVLSRAEIERLEKVVARPDSLGEGLFALSLIVVPYAVGFCTLWVIKPSSTAIALSSFASVAVISTIPYCKFFCSRQDKIKAQSFAAAVKIEKSNNLKKQIQEAVKQMADARRRTNFVQSEPRAQYRFRCPIILSKFPKTNIVIPAHSVSAQRNLKYTLDITEGLKPATPKDLWKARRSWERVAAKHYSS